MTKVLIVEDHASMRESLTTALTSDVMSMMSWLPRVDTSIVVNLPMTQHTILLK